jgi:hypothetical protein
MTSREEEMKERRALARSTNAVTYRDLASLDTSLGGRFSVGGDVSGSEPVVRYPRQPLGSPWNDPLPRTEPPLGWSVEDQEPTGTFEEIEASIANASPAHSPEGDDALMAGQAPSLSQSGDVERPAIPPASASSVYSFPGDAVEGHAPAVAEQSDASAVGVVPSSELADLVSRLVVRNER